MPQFLGPAGDLLIQLDRLLVAPDDQRPVGHFPRLDSPACNGKQQHPAERCYEEMITEQSVEGPEIGLVTWDLVIHQYDKEDHQ